MTDYHRRLNHEIFLLPPEDALTFDGKSAAEKPPALSPWKICYREFSTLDLAPELKEDLGRLLVLEIAAGVVNVYESPTLPGQVSFQSSPFKSEGVIPGSEIDTSLEQRLVWSSPHEIRVSFHSQGSQVQDTPLCVVYNHRDAPLTQAYVPLQFTVEEDNHVEFIFDDAGAAHTYFRNEVILKERAQASALWIVRGKEESRATLIERIVTLAPHSTWSDVQLFAPHGKTRISSRVTLDTHSNSRHGAVVFADHGEFEYEPLQEHVGPKGYSDLKLKMILNKKARANFLGMVRISKEASGCEAFQENKNLLLSHTARVDSLPRLEIYQNDVVCKHGSATEELDKKQMYYLESRGFNAQETKKILIDCFAQDVLGHLNEDHVFFKMGSRVANEMLSRLSP